jgi:2-amino-4-hydroxy-6-hydroxymethyldihydropteridine diphosphokinase
VSRAYIGLGSNMGDRLENLKAGVAALAAAIPEVLVVGKSSVYDSEPVGMTDQPNFLNAVVSLETTLDPYQLLSLLHKIEIDMGRRRITRWGPRTLDMDVLMYGDVEQDDPKLILPHPRLSERRFVLEPLLEIEPAATLPAGTPLKKLLDELGDDQATWRVGEL